MTLLLLCLKIFFCIIINVLLGTIRLVVVVKGKNVMAALIAVCESLVWFLIVREAVLFDSSTLLEYWAIALSYAGGYAMGTLIGGICADKFVGGNVKVQVVTSGKNDELLEMVRNAGYAITVLDVNTSLFGKKKYMIFSEIKSSQLAEFKELVYSLDNKAFVTVQETKYVYNGFFKK